MRYFGIVQCLTQSALYYNTSHENGHPRQCASLLLQFHIVLHCALYIVLHCALYIVIHCALYIVIHCALYIVIHCALYVVIHCALYIVLHCATSTQSWENGQTSNVHLSCHSSTFYYFVHCILYCNVHCALCCMWIVHCNTLCIVHCAACELYIVIHCTTSPQSWENGQTSNVHLSRSSSTFSAFSSSCYAVPSTKLWPENLQNIFDMNEKVSHIYVKDTCWT